MFSYFEQCFSLDDSLIFCLNVKDSHPCGKAGKQEIIKTVIVLIYSLLSDPNMTKALSFFSYLLN